MLLISPQTRKILLLLVIVQLIIPVLFYLQRSYETMPVALSPLFVTTTIQISTTLDDNCSTFINASDFYARGRYVDASNLTLPAFQIPPENRNEVVCARVFMKHFSAYCDMLTEALDNSTMKVGLALPVDLPYCSCVPNTLLGRQIVNLKFNETWDSVEARLLKQGVECGGHWSPNDCRARQRVAVIIPYRDRKHHLLILLHHLHTVLQRQQLDYTIFVVEQREPTSIFNKGMLMNAGFREIILRYGTFDCFVFNDVDMIPEDDRNIYTCHKIPRHVGAYVSKFRYTMCCGGIFGGVTAFSSHQYIKVNGFSNEYYGWGGEDDDMLQRIRAQNLSIIRYPRCVSRYTMIPHLRDKRNPQNPRRKVAYALKPQHYRQIGLNSLTYDAVDHKRLPLYTWILIDLPANITLPDNSTVPRFNTTPDGRSIRVA